MEKIKKKMWFKAFYCWKEILLRVWQKRNIVDRQKKQTRRKIFNTGLFWYIFTETWFQTIASNVILFRFVTLATTDFFIPLIIFLQFFSLEKKCLTKNPFEYYSFDFHFVSFFHSIFLLNKFSSTTMISLNFHITYFQICTKINCHTKI